MIAATGSDPAANCRGEGEGEGNPPCVSRAFAWFMREVSGSNVRRRDL